jgi:hypothetical protein
MTSTLRPCPLLSYLSTDFSLILMAAVEVRAGAAACASSPIMGQALRPES